MPAVQITIQRTLVLLALSFAPVFAANEVSWEGLTIVAPEGKWRHFIGTCTGDKGWSREGIKFLIGTRRYLPPQNPDDNLSVRSTGDLYDIHSFADLNPEVRSCFMEMKGRLVREETIKSASGAAILLFEFEGVLLNEDSSPIRVLLAFREAPAQHAAVEIRCDFSETQAAEARHLFQASLESLSR